MVALLPTNKTPANVFFAPIILRAFPDARIIYTDRDPVDSCFSNFKQYFNPGHFPYSYDLRETAEHYLMVKDYVAHWLLVCPERVISSSYDELVADPHAQIARILDFLGLPFDEACTAPEKNTSGSGTASFAQVRQPIYQSSTQKWRAYERHLQPLLDFFCRKGLISK